MKAVFASLFAFGINLQAISHDFEQQIEKNIEEEYSLSAPTAPAEIFVDIVTGSIEVKGYEGSSVKLSILRKISADDEAHLEKAQDEVTIDITNDGNTVKIYEDGPYRMENGRTNFRGSDYYEYRNKFDVSLLIPHQSNLVLKTVTDGDLSVSNVSGSFDVSNVNGELFMQKMNGHGKAQTINGSVKVNFDKNPSENCTFKTINGDIVVDCRPGLDAEILSKTFNGQTYTDFEVFPIPNEIWAQMKAMKRSKTKEGMLRIRSNGFSGIRIGNGGPQFKFDTLNGDVKITQQGSETHS